MKIMIENQIGLAQTREQLRNMEEIVAELLHQSDTLHPSQLALLLEGPMDVIEHLRGEIDEYLGIKKARDLLARSHSVRQFPSGAFEEPSDSGAASCGS